MSDEDRLSSVTLMRAGERIDSSDPDAGLRTDGKGDDYIKKIVDNGKAVELKLKYLPFDSIVHAPSRVATETIAAIIRRSKLSVSHAEIRKEHGIHFQSPAQWELIVRALKEIVKQGIGTLADL